MKQIFRHSVIENVPFWVLAGASIVMGVTAFFMPPAGEIDPSVIKFIAWMFAFAALWTVFVAMVRGIDATISHGQTTVALNNPDNPAPPEPKGDGQADDELEED